MHGQLTRREDAEPTARDLVSVAIWAMQHRDAPSFPEPRQWRELVDDAGGEHEAPRDQGLARCQRDLDPCLVQLTCRDLTRATLGGRVRQQLLPRGVEDEPRRPAVLAEESVRRSCEAIARAARVDDEYAPAGARELHGGGEAGEAPANGDGVVGMVRHVISPESG